MKKTMLDIEPLILYEDNHLIAVNKPAKVLVMTDRTGDISLQDATKEFLRIKYKKPGEAYLGIFHRIDRPVSGLVVMAKTSKAQSRMVKIFKNRDVEKRYWALTAQPPVRPQGTLKHHLVKDRKKNVVTAYNKPQKNSKEAITSYQIIREQPPYYKWEVKPITGKPHQIRVQMASLGCPIVGDIKYGYPVPNEDASICLHARSMAFIHPVKNEPIVFEAPLPDLKNWQSFP